MTRTQTHSVPHPIPWLENSSPALLAQLEALTQRQFLFVTGKGGVGKSSICGAIGLVAAALGRKTLIVCPQVSHHESSIFGKALNTTPSALVPGLHAVTIDAETSMKQYAEGVLKSRLLAETLFHPRVAGGFLTGIPGLSDWAILGRSWAWTRSGNFRLPRGESQYDLVIVDAPASGDGTKMLGIPRVILDLTPTGRLRADAAACEELLKDARRSQVLLVSLLEELPVTETRENLDVVEQELGMSVGPLIVNRVLEERLTGPQRAAWGDLSSALSAAAASAVRSALHRAARAANQRPYLRDITSWQKPLLLLPELPNFDPSVAGMQRLACTWALPSSREL